MIENVIPQELGSRMTDWFHIGGIVQGCGNSSANALELPQTCTKPSTLSVSVPVSGEAWLEAEGDVLLDFTRSGQNKDLMKKLQAEVTARFQHLQCVS